MAQTYKSLQSIKNFRKTLKKASNHIYSIENSLVASYRMIEYLEKYNIKVPKKMGMLRKNDEREVFLYEIAFIGAYASFEHFMYDFLYDLFRKYPNALCNEKLFSYEEIRNFKRITNLKNFIADKLAVAKSYDIDEWIKVVEGFGINMFNDEEDSKMLKFLNILRNDLLHAGGTTSSATLEKVKKTFNRSVDYSQMRKRHEIFDDCKKLFISSIALFNKIIKNIESS
ncbi:hypothetical protein A2415_03145 [candidate division WWE3 bacterium RIFOXYC1_FULL_39_7]|uniref:RiboL-PSP-HEPN domain-containing protein n=2 Tax=Katanobacteria TaxID=422282 RepID=A0A1F4X9D1_UNCKA|nr:MAG: hypothetical protein A2415_03145 [candidate division WWE3 bacterium RIFOXYC1_FULL_39_7]OGC78278.1 MAG: hypothetical protein A2619_05710 [candidate division WWE3 bacterium RIFOXYD1_FULL_39_9]